MKLAEVSITDFISGDDKVFIIPPFQRNYSWTKQNCKELFDDLIGLLRAKNKQKNHYFGNIIYFNGENQGATSREFILIDGQQRVSTVLLLLCALRDIARTKSDDFLANQIERRYLLTNERNPEDTFRVRLKQTAYDAESFSSIVKNEPKNSNSDIYRNYEFFKESIKNCGFTPSEILDAISQLMIIEINLDIQNDLTAVQKIFEKINSTGRPLTAGDLIRNFLLITKSTKEQERLYKNYWVKIEEQISNEYIPLFAKSFLVLHLCSEIKNENEIYLKFKDYFNDTEHEIILQEMKRYAQYFHYFIFEDIPDEKINRTIQRLNIFKSNDAYSLLMYLFDILYNKDNETLLSIMDLICDYITRYRIVRPSTGGGAMRSIFNQILQKLKNEDIAATHEAIITELSNNFSEAGRFPSNEEFKQKLQESVGRNIDYLKIVLMQIEDYETKNCKIQYNKVSLEHCMPQTLSDQWEIDLGGAEEAARIYSRYLNSIGNLCLMSQGYNSQNSNKIWSEKRVNAKNIQFKNTRELEEYETWTEADIVKRGQNLAERACRAITGPIPRTRPISKKVEAVTGTFRFDELSKDSDFSYSSIKAIIYNNVETKISTWKNLLVEICKIAYATNAERFVHLVENNIIHKSRTTYSPTEKDPIISEEEKKFIKAYPIPETKYFIEGVLSSNRTIHFSKEILKYFNITEQVQIVFVSKTNQETNY